MNRPHSSASFYFEHGLATARTIITQPKSHHLDQQLPLSITHDQIGAFCHNWRILEFSQFGSVLRDDFSPDSDIDVLVQFSPDHPWSLRTPDLPGNQVGPLSGFAKRYISLRAADPCGSKAGITLHPWVRSAIRGPE